MLCNRPTECSVNGTFSIVLSGTELNYNILTSGWQEVDMVLLRPHLNFTEIGDYLRGIFGFVWSAINRELKEKETVIGK